MVTVLEIAQGYVSAGLSIIPILADGSKKPPCRWKAYESEIPSRQQLALWFLQLTRGIAIVGGSVSGNLEILDFDAPGVFEKWLAKCREYPGLFETLSTCVLIQTPTGGHHLYYRLPEKPAGNTQLAFTSTVAPNGTNIPGRPNPKLKAGIWYIEEILIETRGEGGYAIAPGSPVECHIARKPYVLVHGSLESLVTISTQERDVMHTIAKTFDQRVSIGPSIRTYEPKEMGTTGDLTPWADFDQRGDMRPYLQQAGWTFVEPHGNTEYWRRPGKTEGHSATIGHCESAGVPLFYPFSGNAAPFDSQEPYGPSRVYCLLEHKGDWKAACKALYKMGYGKRYEKGLETRRSQRKASRQSLRQILSVQTSGPIVNRVRFVTPDLQTFPLGVPSPPDVIDENSSVNTQTIKVTAAKTIGCRNVTVASNHDPVDAEPEAQPLIPKRTPTITTTDICVIVTGILGRRDTDAILVENVRAFRKLCDVGNAAPDPSYPELSPIAGLSKRIERHGRLTNEVNSILTGPVKRRPLVKRPTLPSSG